MSTTAHEREVEFGILHTVSIRKTIIFVREGNGRKALVNSVYY